MSLFNKYGGNDDDSVFVNFIEKQFTVKNFNKLVCSEYTDKFVIEFKPTDRCNFSCSYCCFHDNSSENLTIENFHKYIEVLKNLDIKQDEIFLFMYGGEPTLHPYMTEWIIRLKELFKDKKFTVLIQSNGMYWTVDDYKHHCEILMEHDVDFRFSFSYHAEKAKLSELKPRINYLMSIDKFDVLTYMITREGIDGHIRTINFLKAMDVPVYVRTILQESEWFLNSEYKQYITTETEEPFIVVDDGGVHCYSFEELAMQGYLNFNGYCCSAGQNVLLLSASGKVYRCDMDFLYDRNPIYDVNNSINPIFNVDECLHCTHKFCSIYYGDKWDEETANISHKGEEPL